MDKLVVKGGARLKGRVETQNRVYLVTKGELDLVKDKFKAPSLRSSASTMVTSMPNSAKQAPETRPT